MPSKSTASSVLPVPRRGEVWQVDWSPGRGSEQEGLRPAIIVQHNQGNVSTSYTNTIVVAVSRKGRDIALHVEIQPTPQNGLRTISYAKCEHILTLSKERLIGKPWGRFSEEDMERVNAAIERSLALS